MIDSIEYIVETIRDAREKKGLSQRALGSKVGIPQSHISKIEQGLVDLQTSSLVQIARALDLELILVSRTHLSLVQALQKSPTTSKPIPAYRLEEDDDDTA